jgi:hypothetical protein
LENEKGVCVGFEYVREWKGWDESEKGVCVGFNYWPALSGEAAEDVSSSFVNLMFLFFFNCCITEQWNVVFCYALVKGWIMKGERVLWFC